MPTTRAPSITRLFAATFIAVALVGLVTQIATWRSARATQAAMVEVAQRLTRIQQHNPSPDVAAEASAASELAADAGDDVVQAARTCRSWPSGRSRNPPAGQLRQVR